MLICHRAHRALKLVAANGSLKFSIRSYPRIRATPRAMSQQPEKSMYSCTANKRLATARCGPPMVSGAAKTRLTYWARLSAMTIFFM